MPLSFLSILSQRDSSRLKVLELRGADFDSYRFADAMFTIGPLDELILLAPHQALRYGMSEWLQSMQHTLKRLDLEVCQLLSSRIGLSLTVSSKEHPLARGLHGRVVGDASSQSDNLARLL